MTVTMKGFLIATLLSSLALFASPALSAIAGRTDWPPGETVDQVILTQEVQDIGDIVTFRQHSVTFTSVYTEVELTQLEFLVSGDVGSTNKVLKTCLTFGSVRLGGASYFSARDKPDWIVCSS